MNFACLHPTFFPLIIIHLAKPISLILSKEAQAVKSVLQGTSSRGHQTHPPQYHAPPPPHPSTTTNPSSSSSTADDKPKKTTTTKKRNLLEVFKKPSNAKEIGKPVQKPQPKQHHVPDKNEIEYIEALKVFRLLIIYR